MNYYLIISIFIINLSALGQNKCVSKIDSLTGKEAFFFTENPPTFSNSKNLESYILNNLTYPKECVEGSVYVGFLVEKNGEITNPRIVKGITPAIDKHALKLINNMPKWNPGFCGKDTVLYYYILPLRVRLAKE